MEVELDVKVVIQFFLQKKKKVVIQLVSSMLSKTSTVKEPKHGQVIGFLVWPGPTNDRTNDVINNLINNFKIIEIKKTYINFSN